MIEVVIFPPPTATRCDVLLPIVGPVIPVVVAVAAIFVSFAIVLFPCSSIEAIALFPNNKAGTDIVATIILTVATIAIDSA